MSTDAYDYTQRTAADDIADIVIGEVVAAKSAQDIENENTIRQIPPGEHRLVVKGFSLGDNPRTTHKVFVDGRYCSFTAMSIGVDLAMEADPSLTIRDYFTLPPDDAREHEAYFRGKKDPAKKNAKEGFEASKFIHFLSKIGWAVPAGGALPPEARQLKNWVGRGVVATVDEGEPWTDKEGKKRMGFNRIHLFSYKATHETVAQATATNGAAQAAAPSRAAAPAPAVAAAVGLNDI